MFHFIKSSLAGSAGIPARVVANQQILTTATRAGMPALPAHLIPSRPGFLFRHFDHSLDIGQ
jgi:hypothetical protein